MRQSVFFFATVCIKLFKTKSFCARRLVVVTSVSKILCHLSVTYAQNSKQVFVTSCKTFHKSFIHIWLNFDSMCSYWVFPCHLKVVNVLPIIILLIPGCACWYHHVEGHSSHTIGAFFTVMILLTWTVHSSKTPEMGNALEQNAYWPWCTRAKHTLVNSALVQSTVVLSNYWAIITLVGRHCTKDLVYT